MSTGCDGRFPPCRRTCTCVMSATSLTSSLHRCAGGQVAVCGPAARCVSRPPAQEPHHGRGRPTARRRPPPLARARLDELLGELFTRAGDVLDTQPRLRVLLDAAVGIARDLDLDSVLKRGGGKQSTCRMARSARMMHDCDGAWGVVEHIATH